MGDTTKVEESSPAVAGTDAGAATTTESSFSGEIQPEVEQAAVTQIEFYLGDSNLPFDKFLYNTWSKSFHEPAAAVLAAPVDSAANPSGLVSHSQSSHDRFYLGWVPLQILTSFKRMSPYLESPPQGLGSIDQVAHALEKLSTAIQVRKFDAPADSVKDTNPTTGEFSPEYTGWFVRRTTELKKPTEAAQLRSVYVKGFPLTETETESEADKEKIRESELSLQKSMESWASELVEGKINSLRMRREDKPAPPGKKFPIKNAGKFKGSVFIEFSSPKEVEKFLALDPKPTFEGKELEIMSKTDYVEMKAKLYTGESKSASSEVPKNPYQRGIRPYNAWGFKLIDDNGFPSLDNQQSRDDKRNDSGASNGDKKRKSDPNSSEEREILFDKVRFTAKRVGGETGSIEIVDEENVGKGEHGWSTGKLFHFVVADKENSFDLSKTSKESGEKFQEMELKSKLAEKIGKPSFVGLLNSRTIAPIPTSTPATTMNAESESVAEKTAAEPKPEATNGTDFPAKGRAVFFETVSDELFEKLKTEITEFQGRNLSWTRATPEEERDYVISRARYHAEKAFDPENKFGASNRGRQTSRGGSRGGRGGNRGGNRGGRGNKRQRRD